MQVFFTKKNGFFVCIMVIYGKIRKNIMIDVKKIHKELCRKWQSGVSQTALAAESGLSQSYIADLLSGKRSVDGLTLRKFNQLFPDSVVHLYGDKVKITANENKGNVVGINHGAVNCNCMDWAMEKILGAEELTADEKIKMLKVLKG